MYRHISMVIESESSAEIIIAIANVLKDGYDLKSYTVSEANDVIEFTGEFEG